MSTPRPTYKVYDICHKTGLQITPQTIICPSCGKNVSYGIKFCNYCGNRIENSKQKCSAADMVICKACGKSILASAKFCNFCGEINNREDGKYEM